MNNDQLIGDCVLRAQSLRALAEQIGNEEFPRHEPVQLARALANLGQALAEHMVSIRNSASYDPVKDRVTIQTINSIVTWLFPPLRYAEGAMTAKVPWSLVNSLQHFTARILPNTVLVLRPKWRYNYSVVMSDIVPALRQSVARMLPPQKIDECLAELQSRLHIISFPYIERRSILLHAALGHEIGHIIAEGFVASDKSPLPSHLLNVISDQVNKDATVPALFKSKVISSRLSECAEYRKRALQELGSDLVAVHMLGPSALFALDAVIGMRTLDIIPGPENDRYPPRRMRIRVSLKEMESELPGLVDWRLLDAVTPENCKYILSSYRSHIEALQAIASSDTDMVAISKHTVVDIAYRWVGDSMAAMRRYIETTCAGKSEVSQSLDKNPLGDKEPLPKGSGFWRTIIDLANGRLAANLPPNTHDDSEVPPRPASFEAIMASGWLCLLSKASTCPTADPKSMRDFVELRQRIERLTLRALELSDLQHRYIKYASTI